LDIFNEQFKDYNCSVTFSKVKKSEEYLYLSNNQDLFNGIKQSASESELPPDVRIKFNVEYFRGEADNPIPMITFSPSNYLLRVQQHSLEPFNSVADKRYDNKTSLQVEAYNANLSFPFQLYNRKKSELYKSFSASKEIFQSKFNVIVVPISLNEDTLTADVFLDYLKITLDDIPRWTPIKKKVKLTRELPLAINLPKENWSANFIRNGEKYDIYGYSDYERYVNEYLIISFESLKQIEGK